MKTIKLRHTVDMYVEATISLETGRGIVELRSDNAFDDGQDLTPTEARTLARALHKQAAIADWKASGRKGRRPTS